MRIEDYRVLLRKQNLQSLVGILSTIDAGKFPERAEAAKAEISRRKEIEDSGEHANPADAKEEKDSIFVFRWVTFHFAFYSYLIIGACIRSESPWFNVPFAIGALGFAIGYFYYLTCPYCKRYPKTIVTFLPSIPFLPPRKCRHCQSEFWWKKKEVGRCVSDDESGKSMQCIKCGMSLAVSAVHRGLTCFSCGSLFLEIESLSVEPVKFDPEGLVSRPADVLCPSDGSELALLDLDGLAVEICPKCAKVWLEKGELERFKQKYGRKEDTPLWKRHQQQLNEGKAEPWETLDWILECIYWAS